MNQAYQKAPRISKVTVEAAGYRWRVYGVVTHFGHTHARINEYEAEYLVRHNGRSWRITESRVRQNKRVTMDKA